MLFCGLFLFATVVAVVVVAVAKCTMPLLYIVAVVADIVGLI